MRIRTPTDIAALVRDRRRAQGLDQRTLATRVGVSREWIVALEHGKAGASLGLVLRTLDALGITLEVASGNSARRSSRTRKIIVPDVDAIVRAARKPAPPKGRR